MYKFSNLTDAKNKINQFKMQNWTLKFSSTKYRLNLRLFIQPSNNFLGIFNRLTETEQTSTFSIDLNLNVKYYKYLINEITKYIQNERGEELEILGERIDNKNKLSISKDIDKNNTIENFENHYDKIIYVIENVFSSNFIRQNKINTEGIKIEIEKLHTELQSSKDNKPKTWRIEEIKDDLRVILLVSPIDFDMKLTFTSISDEGIYNPITNYFQSLFSYEILRFNRFTAKHEIDFFEEQGYPKYPLCLNNKQQFKIKFNLYSEGDSIKIYKRSAASLKKFLKSTLFIMELFLGNDIFGKSKIDREFDYFKGDEKTTELIKNMLFGNRIYSSPVYDISILFNSEIFKDDNGVDFLISVLDMKIFPFDNKTAPNIGTYLHPLIYEMDK